MKAKLFALLKQGYSALGLGDEILMGLAGALATPGVVTDENIQMVVSAQKEYLEGLQRANDKRVNDALDKERKKHAEETLKQKEEAEKAAKAQAEADAQAKKEAEAKEKAAAETKEKAAAETEAKKQAADEQAKLLAEIEALKEKGASESVIEFLKASALKQGQEQTKAAEDSQRMMSAYQQQIDSLRTENALQQDSFAKMIEELRQQTKSAMEGYQALKTENDAAKAAKAKADRQGFIISKAKELGVPQWRIDEGFALAEDANEDVIAEKLATIASNIKTSQLPSSNALSFPKGDNKPTAQEIADFAKTIVR